MVSAPVRWTAAVGTTAVALVWLWRGMGVAASGSAQAPAPSAAPVADVAAAALPFTAAPGTVAVPAAAPPMPYTYVGSWREGPLLHLLLKRGDVTHSVSGLRAVDAQYVVVAADEERVSLRYLPLGSVQVIRRQHPQPAPGEVTRAPSARSDSEAQSSEN